MILDAYLDVEVLANTACAGVQAPWLDQERSGTNVHRAGPEGRVPLLRVIEPEEEILRLVGGDCDAPVGKSELPMQLIGHLRSPHWDRVVTSSEDNSFVVQLLDLCRHRTIGNHHRAALRWPLARSPRRAAGHDHNLVRRRGYHDRVRELQKGNATMDA
jgi:hypothetical protein